jgi:hypothetical protein
MTEKLGPEDPCDDCGIKLKYHLVDSRGRHYDCEYAANNVGQGEEEAQE